MRTKIDYKTLQDFLQKMKTWKHRTTRELSGYEIEMAEELVSLKLLSKTTSSHTSTYSYSVKRE